MLECERGPACCRPYIDWRFAHAKRVPLLFQPEPGLHCEADLLFSEVLLIEILVEQWRADEGVIAANRGFVHAFDLARRYQQRSGRPRDAAPITKAAIEKYFSRMRGRIAKAIEQAVREIRERGGEAPDLPIAFDLIENRPNVGYRIAGRGLRIDDAFRTDSGRR